MTEGLMMAVAALGEQVQELKKQLEVKDFMLEKARKALFEAEKENEELRREEIKKALEE
ncbi:MAG: hypothetical protein IJD91_01175 [Clostridia bacterium]|nr:hypothetical protein [Clostridia bacterium]